VDVTRCGVVVAREGGSCDLLGKTRRFDFLNQRQRSQLYRMPWDVTDGPYRTGKSLRGGHRRCEVNNFIQLSDISSA